MMTNLEQIKNRKFNKSGLSGYKATQVDEFIVEVQGIIENLEKKCLKYSNEVKSLTEELTRYKQEESYIKDVLINAKKSAEKELAEAKCKANYIINDAVEKSKEKVKDNEIKIKSQEDLLSKMKKEVVDFKAKLLNEYKSHLKILSSIEGVATRIQDKGTPSSLEDQSANKETEQTKSCQHDSEQSQSSTFLKKVDKLGGIKFGKSYDIQQDSNSPVTLFK